MVALFTGAFAAAPALAAPPPIVDYARYPDYQTPVLSPNGNYLAVLVPINGRANLAVIDLTKRASKVLTSIERFDVLNPVWLGNERLVFTLGQQNTPTGAGHFEGGGLFMVSRDGNESRRLAPTVREMLANNQRIGRFMSLLATIPDNDREVIVAENARSADGYDLYRLDVTTGRTVLLTETRPERVQRYVLDRNRVARVAVSSVKDKRISIVWYRENEESPWVELARLDDEAGGGGDATTPFRPLAFDNDNKTLLVATNRGRDTIALFRYDVQNRKLGDVVAGHPHFDMGTDMLGGVVPGLILDTRTREVLGYRVEAEQRQIVWTDETMARLQATIDRALPNRVNEIQRTGGRLVVNSYSDRTSPEFWLFDEASRKLEPLVAAMSWLKPEHLVEVRPFTLKTRDGLEIPSYYLLPRDHKPGDRHPTVVHVHGGPHARADRWGPLWYGGYGIAEAQLLASRGYAVVLPNFRITTGLGSRIYAMGRRTVGRQMSEDHEDAVKWAVEQGFAEPNRVCITGASYGGYATLHALAKTPDLFKCGIAGLSVSDMELQLTSTAGDTAYSVVGQNFWLKELIGEDRKPGTAREISPLHQAAQIKAPLMFYAGADDIRTPLEQTTRMVDALRKLGQQPVVVIKTEEGHGFGRIENRVEVWEKMLEFLDRHIGAGSKP